MLEGSSDDDPLIRHVTCWEAAKANTAHSAGLAIAEDRLNTCIWAACATGSGPPAILSKLQFLLMPMKGKLLKAPRAKWALFEVKGRLNIADTPEGSYFYRPRAQPENHPTKCRTSSCSVAVLISFLASIAALCHQMLASAFLPDVNLWMHAGFTTSACMLLEHWS